MRENLNRTLNSLDEINSMEKYPKNYNVRNNARPKALIGDKQALYHLLEEFRGMYSDELSSNYWLLQ